MYIDKRVRFVFICQHLCSTIIIIMMIITVNDNYTCDYDDDDDDNDKRVLDDERTGERI